MGTLKDTVISLHERAEKAEHEASQNKEELEALQRHSQGERDGELERWRSKCMALEAELRDLHVKAEADVATLRRELQLERESVARGEAQNAKLTEENNTRPPTLAPNRGPHPNLHGRKSTLSMLSSTRCAAAPTTSSSWPPTRFGSVRRRSPGCNVS